MAAVKQVLDFIVIGAQKAGTTSLFEYLRRHPELCLPAAKEVPYFSHDANYGHAWNEYLRKAFAFAEPACKWGTVTPHYMVGGIYDAVLAPSQRRGGDERTVPTRIYERVPDVRLIAILRDPVERARSHHTMAAMNGWDNRPFAEAVRDLLAPDALRSARQLPDERTGYVVWGEYGRILSGYVNVFPRDQLLVLYTADLKENPAAVLERVFEFLGVARDVVPSNIGTTYRPSGAVRRLPWADLNRIQSLASGNSLLRRLWQSTPEPTRRRIDRQFDRANYWMDLWNRRAGQVTSASEPETVQALREHYEEDAQRLAAVLGAAAPWSMHALVAGVT